MLLLTIDCPDQTGLVAAITGYLFELGINLGDATYTLLGTSAEFTTVCELPADLHPETLAARLGTLPELQGASIRVSPIGLSPYHGTRLEATHQITVWGNDHPGALAHLTQVFTTLDANIVQLIATKIPAPLDGKEHYVVRMSVWIPEGHLETCLTALADAARTLHFHCSWKPV